MNDDARISFFLTTLFLLYRDNIQRNSSIFLIELYAAREEIEERGVEIIKERVHERAEEALTSFNGIFYYVPRNNPEETI